MPWVGFEPTIPAFERAKTFQALDCAVTVIVTIYFNVNKFCILPKKCIYGCHVILRIK
jgi:hypothetical protein